MQKLLVGIGTVVFLIIIFILATLGTVNQEVILRTGFEAAEKNVTISLGGG